MILDLTFGLWLLALSAARVYPGLEPRSRRELQLDLGAVGLIGLATSGFFWRLLFEANTWMPAGGGDLAGFIFPTYSFAAEWLKRGVLPLWNPSQFAGAPFIGDIQSGIGYPLNWITFLLSSPLAYRDLELLGVLHFFIAGAGMYACLRFGRFLTAGTSLARAACLTGALAFEFSDLFVTHFGNLNLIAVAAWMPLIFLFFSRGLDKPDGLSATVAGILLALAFLAGHIQPFLFILLALSLYASYRALADRQKALAVFASTSITVLIGLGLCAFVLLPALEMTQASVRNAFTYSQAIDYSLPPAQLVGLLVPGFFGRGVEATWAPWPRVEVGYIGVLPLILALLALLLKNDTNTRFFGLLACVGLALALGGYSILFGWLYGLVPGFGQLRAPARFIYLMDFGIAVLSAIGLDTLLKPPSEERMRAFGKIRKAAPWAFLIISLPSAALALAIMILGQGQDPALFARITNAVNAIFFFILLLGCSIALFVTAKWDSPTRHWWAALAIALVCFDLFSLGANIDIGANDPTVAFQRQDVVGYLLSRPGPSRIDSRTDVEGSWPPATATLFGLQDANGDNPLLLAAFNNFWETLGGRESTLYDMLNTRYLLARPTTPLPGKFRRVLDAQGSITVYENPSATSRAWTVYSSQLAPNDDSELQLVHSRSFDPRSYVVLEGVKGVESLNGQLPMDEAQVLGYGPNEIELQAVARQRGYLVLSEVYYPGWRAFVDGNETEVLRADYLFRALALTPGQHHIKLVYDPPTFKIGLAISLFTITGLAAAVILKLRKSKHLLGEH